MLTNSQGCFVLEGLHRKRDWSDEIRDSRAESRKMGRPFRGTMLHPDSQIPTPKSRLPNLQSRLLNLQSRLLNLDSRLSNLDSRISTPKSRLPNLESRISTFCLDVETETALDSFAVSDGTARSTKRGRYGLRPPQRASSTQPPGRATNKTPAAVRDRSQASICLRACDRFPKRRQGSRNT